jgi:hypothetical protein
METKYENLNRVKYTYFYAHYYPKNEYRYSNTVKAILFWQKFKA